ncbi:hypothetical protein BDL97_06G026200 [Sphagnum fallax]|nr:hypothetical protein BDL97_06G026200 [Sphagnum fallax]
MCKSLWTKSSSNPLSSTKLVLKGCKIESEPAVVRRMQTKLSLGPHC